MAPEGIPVYPTCRAARLDIRLSEIHVNKRIMLHNTFIGNSPDVCLQNEMYTLGDVMWDVSCPNGWLDQAFSINHQPSTFAGLLVAG